MLNSTAGMKTDVLRLDSNSGCDRTTIWLRYRGVATQRGTREIFILLRGRGLEDSSPSFACRFRHRFEP